MARGEQDPGLVSAAVAWVEAAQALAEAAPGVGGPVAGGQVGAGACGSPWAARDPEARAVRVRVEEPARGGGRNGRSWKMANRLRPAAWRKGWRRARLAGNGRRRVPSRGGRRPRDAGIVRSIGEGAEGSGLVADGCADFPIAIERDARARAVHAAASAGGVSGAGSGRQTGQAHAAEAG